MRPDEQNGGSEVLIVSNRLPVRIRVEDGEIREFPSSGGLASALRAVTEVRGWIGWPGAAVEEPDRPAVTAKLAERRLVPVFVDAAQERDYYAGMCNSVLWPLLHYFPDKVVSTEAAWEAYREVNRRFADAVAEHARPGDTVWVHDFHLMLLPQLLRARRPDLRLGFFLHVPFPSSEVWRLVPQREELLLGLLGADYIGFHTPDYLRHFRDSCLRVLGRDAEPDAIRNGPRRVYLGVDPLGPDVAAFRAVAETERVRDHVARYSTNWLGRRLILGVERLDYTKGIPHKLRAFERLLEREPERVTDTVMLQVLVPSREEAESYLTLLRDIQREVGRINGRFGAPGRMPLEFMHRSLDRVELAALYRLADACVVSPLRDGMNLVAHEYVLCQGLELEASGGARGMLVLSEFAGAALSLPRAILVNPWDPNAVADAISRSLKMAPLERDDRIAGMYERVLEMDSARWSRRFLDRLAEAAARNAEHAIVLLTADKRRRMVARFAEADRRRLFLDYDGTLREIAQVPEQAQPTPVILDLLRTLTGLRRTEVHVVSGRRRTTLESWLGHLSVHLCAEHGFASRAPGGAWFQPVVPDLGWMPMVLEVFERASESLPGSFLEKKPCGYAWHYRTADPGYGPWRARELHQQLNELLEHEPAEVLPGHAVLEVRAKGADKGAYLEAHCRDLGGEDFVLCAGDDRTDQDMFRRLPGPGFAVSVGGGFPGATDVVATPADLRELLAELAQAVT